MARAPVLTTERLVLRAFEPADLAAFQAFAESDDYLRFLTADHPDATTFVTRNIGVDPVVELAWVITRAGEVIGSAFLAPPHADRPAKLAYLVDPAHWSDGIASEAAAAVVTFGFDELGYDRIGSWADARHTASLRVMEKLGFDHVDTRAAGRPARDGVLADEVVTCVTAAGWRQRG